MGSAKVLAPFIHKTTRKLKRVIESPKISKATFPSVVHPLHREIEDLHRFFFPPRTFWTSRPGESLYRGLFAAAAVRS